MFERMSSAVIQCHPRTIAILGQRTSIPKLSNVTGREHATYSDFLRLEFHPALHEKCGATKPSSTSVASRQARSAIFKTVKNNSSREQAQGVRIRPHKRRLPPRPL